MWNDELRMYVYGLYAIDYWDGWTDLNEVRRNPSEYGFDDLDGTLANVAKAARAAGWEGDGPWRCAPLPLHDSGGRCDWMFAVKQSNNGTTWIVSPFPLTWLNPAIEWL